MNVIVVLIDSLNRHALSAYGPSPVATPNLDAFADRAWRLDNHFVGSLPCMPARREIFAGFKEMMWRPWGPLEPFDHRLPKLLADHGHATGIVTDHYHYWEPLGNEYVQSFRSAEFIRGHESDFWKLPVPAGEPVPGWVERIEEWRPGSGRRYYANVRDFRTEEDFFPAKVMTAAARWLEDNARQAPFYLQIESFDVHEPFHIPEPYASMYWDGPDRDHFNVWPPYQNAERQAAFMAGTTAEELAFIRSQYAGKLSMVDRWFGEVLAAFDRLSLWDDTVVILTTDHGHDLGEHGGFAKSYPHWDSHANIPAFVWHPAHPGNGRGIPALTATVDLFATVLDAAGAPRPDAPHSQSMLPLLSGDQTGARVALTYGMYGQGVCCTDGEWTVFKSPEQEGPLFFYSSSIFTSLREPSASGKFIPGVTLPQWQIPTRSLPRSYENFLFHRRVDPGQERNLWETEPRQRGRMLDVLRGVLAREGTPPEQYLRLGIPPA